MEDEIFMDVWESKLSCQTNLSFSSFVGIDNGVAICNVLSDDELTNAALGNYNDDISDVAEVLLCCGSIGSTPSTGGLLFP